MLSRIDVAKGVLFWHCDTEYYLYKVEIINVHNYISHQNKRAMKYTISNIINKPLDEVIAKFKDPEAAKEWMEGLKSHTLTSGTAGEVGAKTDFVFLHKGKEMIISETILEQNFPDQIKFAYQSPMGENEVEMLFEQLPDGTVKQTNNSYFKLTGFMKLFGFLLKGMFKKQSFKYLNGFKEYAER